MVKLNLSLKYSIAWENYTDIQEHEGKSFGICHLNFLQITDLASFRF